MTGRHFGGLCKEQWAARKFLCVGLDPDLRKIPEHLRAGSAGDALLSFCKSIVDATHDIAAAFKPNTAFFEAHGEDGERALRDLISYIHAIAPKAPVILDAKRADIGNTNAGYVASAFDLLGADAVTVHPYLGSEAIQPFLEREDKGVIVLCRTSNAGAAEFQDLIVDGEPLYKIVARHVSVWNTRGNCGLVVGATYPTEIAEVRSVAPELPFLIPGVGAQGGDIEKTVAAARDANGAGMLINVSRGILYAGEGSDFAALARQAARGYDEAIKNAL